MTNIFIVEDHTLVAEGLCRIIDESDIARVVGKYYNLKSCREGLTKDARGVMLLDIELPDGNGVDFCAEIKEEYPGLKIIILTGFKEFNIAKHALHNGALGYVLKNADSEEIFAAIETVSRGEQFLCEEIDLLLKDKKDTQAIWLTNREKEVLRYTAEGYTAKETASLMFRDVETIRKYRRNLFIKLKAKNMADLIRIGYEMKLI